VAEDEEEEKEEGEDDRYGWIEVRDVNIESREGAGRSSLRVGGTESM
jgi:hypothetical protein